MNNKIDDNVTEYIKNKSVIDTEKNIYEVCIKNNDLEEDDETTIHFDIITDKKHDSFQAKLYALEYLESLDMKEEDYTLISCRLKDGKIDKLEFVDKGVKSKGYYVFEYNLLDELDDSFSYFSRPSNNRNY